VPGFLPRSVDHLKDDNFKVTKTKAGQEVDLFSPQYDQSIDVNNLRNPES
jgi:hypothetical protein